MRSSIPRAAGRGTSDSGTVRPPMVVSGTWHPAAVAVGVALVYLVCGIIGMSLAIPPAQASPLFPAAGLAVAAVLRHGAPGVAGVWLGQAMMQIVWHGLGGGTPTPALLACWGILSIGAALQAAVAVGLLRYRDRSTGSDAEGRRLFGLLFLCGMIACTVSASFGVATLTAAGFVGPGDFAKAWWEWYSGDTLGVFIFAPVVVMLLERPEIGWNDDLLRVLPRVGLVTLLILVAFVVVRRWESKGIDTAVRDASLTIANGIAARAAGSVDADAVEDAAEIMARHARDYLGDKPLPAGLRLRLRRDRAGEAAICVFDSRPGPEPTTGRRLEAAVPVAHGPWTLELSADAGFESRGYDLSWGVALLSLFLTGILADRDLAAHAARARETRVVVEKERMERDLVIARDIQRELMPKHDTYLEGFDVSGWNQPADETGGDYYDFVPLGDGLLAVAIADVTGHGIGAALVVAEVRALFRAEILRTRRLEEAVSDLHSLLACDLPDQRFVTACFAIVSADRCSVSYLSAGQGPLLFRSAAGGVRSLRPQGLPIGFLPEPRYAAAVELSLAPGDVFMVLTDGFVEWTNRDGRQFGLERIEAILVEHGHRPAAEIISRLREAVLAFAGGTPQADDLTAVVVRRPPGA